MGIFERYLSVWVALCISGGIAFGLLVPDLFAWIAEAEYAQVNLIVAVLIWAMIFPMMTQVNLTSIKLATREPKGLILTLVVNWLIKPFTMFALGYFFFYMVFADFISPENQAQYLAGLILLGVAPCTAMVFVWSQLTRGDASYTLLQVSVNDVILIFAFAPIAGLLLGLTELTVPWATLTLSVLLYVVIPFIAAMLVRWWLLRKGPEALVKFQLRLKPTAVIGLCLTVLILFGLQAQSIVNSPFVMLLIAVPLVLQTYLIYGIALTGAWYLRLPSRIAAPACLIGTSNFFELAVAVAIGVFGITSGAALATVVGVLVEVPVMLSLVALSNRMAPWLNARSENN
ncbi:ACR3 family arsenite efflux transporter [Aliidiomarina halalkaliphila]|uniref:ACR3 family arsenite efflux transporter n=1 Tax=Aliidiomarina halalkaliphila TaxID=2593535 RepID=A0A552X5C7_9GAMM|nr:ACR3 family arsenite efflux transporter [Aliidiomarina halalkaliphila]TRW50227.1 ACR3 family arsenite efflux transporter [Aliidiomarina halalkaliphila]